MDGSFDDVVGAIGKQVVGFQEAAERVAMGNQMGCVDFVFGNQLHDVVAIAGIDAAGLERQIFAIHPWQGQNLFLLVECDNRDDGIGTGTTPCEFKCIVASGNLDYSIGPSTLCQ